MTNKKNVTLICDLQFGSTGKGLIAGYLAKRNRPDVLVSAWSPNAGHTYIDERGNTMIHTMLANGIVSDSVTHVLIGPGSVVNLQSLFDEVSGAIKFGYLAGVQILIHPHAAIVQHWHREQEEKTMTAIGSTKKGSGAALIEKIERNPHKAIVAKDVVKGSGEIFGWEFRTESDPCVIRVAGYKQYDGIIDQARNIQVEGAQGFSLGINSGFYPYTTSRECTPAQIMTDCHIPITKLAKVVGTMRTFPIRVANRFDGNGKQVGWSGPHYPDQEELEWSQLGIEPELTTVTKLPRRVFTFSYEQSKQAIRMCQPDEIFLNFCNYLPDADIDALIDAIHEAGGLVRFTGHGPTDADVVDLEKVTDAEMELDRR